MADPENLVDFETIEQTEPVAADAADAGGETVHYSGARISGFREMLLKAEIYRALADASFEHPSEVQHQCIGPAILGRDILCQAKSGMGKTAVFVLSTLQRLNDDPPKDGKPRVLVIAHTHEMAHQILMEFQRFAKHMPNIRDRMVKVHGGAGRSREGDAKSIREKKPVIVVGCPGRILDIATDPKAPKQEPYKVLDLSKVEMFVVDECDKLLDTAAMQMTITKIFLLTPQQKQTMMFSATMPQESRVFAKKYMKDPLDIFVDSEKQLTLHGLAQYYLPCAADDKARILGEFIDRNQHLNQTVIFVNSVQRAEALAKGMNAAGFPTLVMHGLLPSEQRTKVYDEFKACAKRFLVATELFSRGVDVQAVTVVINYDAPEDREKNGEKVLKGSDQYFHRVGRAGRFGTKGVALTLVSSEEDRALLENVQKRFEVRIQETSMDKLGELTNSLASA